MLIELELIDFMSHEHTKINFHSGLNVFFGRKGSGKTAILEAIRLLFGGLGRERASSLSSMIRYGKQKAIIRVKLRNRVKLPNGETVTLLEEYPLDEIVLERILFADGRSVFKLNGRTVTKADIQRMLAKVNINARNTLFFLPQERVNDWIRMKPQERFDLLLSALGLKELKDKIAQLREEIARRRREREKYLKTLMEWERKLEEARKKAVPTPKVKDFFDRYFTIKVAYLTARKAAIEAQISELREREEGLRRRLEEIEREAGSGEALMKIDEEIGALEREIDKLQKERLKLQQERGRLEEKEAKLLDSLSAIDDRVKKYQELLRRLEEEYGTTDTTLLREEIERLREEARELEKELEENELVREIKRIEERVENLGKELKLREQELKERRKDLEEVFEALDKPETFSKVYQFARAYREHGVYGPIIFKIALRVSYELQEHVVPLIEGVLGRGFLRALVVTSPEAYRRAVQFLRTLKGGEKYVVYDFGTNSTSEAEERARRIIEEARRRRQELERDIESVVKSLRLGPGVLVGWLCDFIDAPLPVKAIIEAKFWDYAIVVDAPTARALMSRSKLSRVVTLDDMLIIERHGPEFMRYMATRAIPESVIQEGVLMKLGVGGLEAYEEELRALEEEIEEIKEQIKSLQQKAKKLESSLPREYKELIVRRRELLKKAKALEDAIAEISRARRLLDESPDRADKIRAALASIRERIDEIEEKLEELSTRTRELQKKRAELLAKKELILKQKYTLAGELDRIRSELQEIPAQIKGLERMKAIIESDIEETKRRMKAVYYVLHGFGLIEDEPEEYVKKRVLKGAERLIEERSPEELEKMMQELEEDVKYYEEQIFKSESRAEELKEASMRISELKKQIAKIDEEMEKIRRLYEAELKEIIAELRHRVKHIDEAYKRIISLLGANGWVELHGDSLDKVELRIYASIHRDEPMEIERGNFSSGEKTTIIMSLIMALLLTNPPPVFMFDEFDVYLDDVSLKELMAVMKQALKGFQGIITTTHREEIIEVADRIFYVEFDEKAKRSRVRRIDIAGKSGEAH